MARVLLVDDEPTILDVLSNVVRSVGHEPVTASRGDIAIDLLKDENFDLLISDLRMTPVDGMQVLAAAHRIRPAMPTLMLTAYSSEESRAEAGALGVFAYLTKPFGVKSLLDTITRALAAPPKVDSAGQATTDSAASGNA